MWPRRRELPPLQYALSIRQPWAGLVIYGHKTIEVRSWRTGWRGRIYVHSGRLADDRPYAWEQVPEEARALTALRGGLIGTVELTGCIAYPTAEEFRNDRTRHLNDPDWYRAGLHGFTMADAQVVPFRPLRGRTLLFKVPDAEGRA